MGSKSISELKAEAEKKFEQHIRDNEAEAVKQIPTKLKVTIRKAAERKVFYRVIFIFFSLIDSLIYTLVVAHKRSY